MYFAYACAAGGYTALDLAPLLRAITDAQKKLTQPHIENARSLASISKRMHEVEQLCEHSWKRLKKGHRSSPSDAGLMPDYPSYRSYDGAVEGREERSDVAGKKAEEPSLSKSSERWA
ncbi:hypothetical protein LTS18_005261 [Coniosporium uncinatum]|uniref:Uncharacterized protein n=1 Tax=Coniosporium uncinatum TaxID=93489 RepID=A0ACC3D4V3_9PEZI|nr:hypothetical protein LTS18_005261 [Coniosporium uncinatum]